MKILTRLLFRYTNVRLKGRGTGFVEAAKDGSKTMASMEKNFTKLLLQHVGLKYVYKHPSMLEDFATTLLRKPKKKSTRPDPRRAKNFASVLVQHINDILISGELDEYTNELNIFISKSELDDNFKELRLHWDAQCNEKDEETQKILDRLAPKLRACLTELNILGHVPLIRFVADYSRRQAQILDEKFAQMEFPATYKPSFNPTLFPVAKFGNDIPVTTTTSNNDISKTFDGITEIHDDIKETRDGIPSITSNDGISLTEHEESHVTTNEPGDDLNKREIKSGFAR